MRRLLAAATLVGALALSGCATPSNTPGDYDTQVRQNFVLGCTRSAADSGDFDVDVENLPPSACECRYEWFVANIPYDDEARDQLEGYDGPTFQSLNSDAGNDEALPADIIDGLAAACGDGGGSGGGGGDSTSTTASDG